MDSLGLDIKTLALVAALAAFLQAAALILLWRSVPRSPATPLWALAGGCLALGGVLLSQRDALPELLTLFAGNVVIMTAHVFYLAGFARHFDKAIRIGLVAILPLAVFSALLFVFLFLHEDRDLRVLTICVTAFYFCMLHVWLIFSAHRTAPSRLNQFIIGCWFFHGGFVLFRGVYQAASDVQLETFLEGGWIHELAFIDMIVWCLAFAILLPALELQKAHRRMTAAHAALASADRMKSTFRAALSHDLRTPLNPIIGFATIIEQRLFGDGASDRYAENARLIRTAAEGMLELLNDLLDFEKMESGRLETRPEPVRLAAVLDEQLDLFAPVAQGRSITLSGRFAIADGLQLRVDPRMLWQMLNNLLSNALKFAPDGGAVDLIAEETAQGLRITVLDNGPGISDALAERIGEPFLTAPANSAAPAAGASGARSTGLGLALVTRMIAAHGGALTVRRRADARGTEAVLVFPIAALSVLAPAAEAETTKAA